PGRARLAVLGWGTASGQGQRERGAGDAAAHKRRSCADRRLAADHLCDVDRAVHALRARGGGLRGPVARVAQGTGARTGVAHVAVAARTAPGRLRTGTCAGSARRAAELLLVSRAR